MAFRRPSSGELYESKQNMTTAREAVMPPARSGHVAVCIGKFMIVWGGYNDKVDGMLVTERYVQPDEIHVYRTDTEHWESLKTTGDIPPGTSGACAVAIGNSMYVICGHTSGGHTNEIYRLDVHSLRWTHIVITENSAKPSPRDKFAAWEYKNRLYIFGGFGVNMGEYLWDDGEFHLDTASWGSVRGWNNQLCIFDPKTESWSKTVCRGTIPSPRAAHALVHRTNSNQAYLFGGRHDQFRLSDLYRLDLDTLTWHRIDVNGEVPRGRSWHGFTSVTDDILFLYGGYSQNEDPLGDAWLFDTVKVQWRQLEVEDKPRLWHTVCYGEDGDILVFGGCSSNILHPTTNPNHRRDILVFRLSPKSLFRLCLDAVVLHKDSLESQWYCLPTLLQERLTLKLKGHGTSSMEQRGRTCVIS